MSQRHGAQFGTFHITTNSRGRIPWCTWDGVPDVLIDNIFMTRNLHGAKVFAFSILSDHMHLMIEPGGKGLSAFMHSFKRTSSKDVHYLLSRAGSRTRATVGENHMNRSRGSVTPAVGEFSGWQNGFYDERIRDVKQRTAALSYIRYNALHHHFVENIDDWAWTSLHYPHLLDPLEIWFT